jgi:hypothetical protein
MPMWSLNNDVKMGGGGGWVSGFLKNEGPTPILFII